MGEKHNLTEKGIIMKKNDIKRKYSRKIAQMIDGEKVKFVILFIPLVFLLIDQIIKKTFSIDEFLDTGILVSFLIVFICDIIAKAIANYIYKNCEDVNKLITDYKALVDKYCIDNKRMIKTRNCKDEIYIPVICEAMANANGYLNINICENDANKQYELPEQIKNFSQELMKAHENSITFNNRNIRIDDLQKTEHGVDIKYSMTTYYDSLITNRAMDYELANGKTIRDIFEPGPYISDLKDSKMSNHLGFNGFVELNDGKIIFVERSKNLSIGKGTLANSIGASMKTKYCLNDNRQLDINGISNAIRKEIEDELKIEIPDTENEKLANSIFAFYRDLVEGGKPQFLFYYKTDEYDETSFKEHFKKCFTNKDNENVQIDGSKFHFYTLEELRKATISSEKLCIDGESYSMMPSASASVVMLIE